MAKRIVLNLGGCQGKTPACFLLFAKNHTFACLLETFALYC